MEKRVVFKSPWLPYALVAPQLIITLVFFFWPASQALYWSLLIQDAFAARTQFVGLDNFRDLFHDPHYIASFQITAGETPGPNDDRRHDIVMMDDFIYGEPQPLQ